MLRSTRRQFLAQSSWVTLGSFPSLLHSGAHAAETNTTNAGRILVVIQMTGGNDGINTIVPFADEGYAQHRKQLRLRMNDLIKISDFCGLHPSMRAAADLIEDGRLAIVQGVGYPSPNRSHDISMAIWHSAQVSDKAPRSHGWLGRAMDRSRPNMSLNDASQDPEMILIGDEAPPLAIRSRRSTAIAVANLHDLQLNGIAEQTRRQSAIPTSDLARFVQQTAFGASHTASLMESNLITEIISDSTYPSTKLALRLRSVAKLIKSGFSTPVYYTIQGGYDTHTAQLPSHSRLLREFSGAIKALLDDLAAAGLADRVVVMGFSEFGRRVTENASAGTDHGTAGPVFVAGEKVNAGLIGETPSLVDLLDGDLRMSIDFRQIYSSVLSDWLCPGYDADPQLPGPDLKLFAT